jgi:inosine/xanthosine triphosphate pyrophosphatase family protein
MQQLLFSTGNHEKFEIAQATCQPLGLELQMRAMDIDEIQAEDSEVVIARKARDAFAATGQPVVVSDDSWNIPGLRGFPGPYMKSMDYWFTPQDFINLTRPLEDRRIILVQLLAYQDTDTQKIFRREYTGALLTEPRGTYGQPLKKVVTMPGDNGLSIAEVYDQEHRVHTDREVSAGWRDLATWYLQEYA